jgi:hypothetical protein
MSVNHSNGNLFCDLSHFPSLTVLIQINRVVFALAKLALDWLVPHLQINEALITALKLFLLCRAK